MQMRMRDKRPHVMATEASCMARESYWYTSKSEVCIGVKRGLRYLQK